jgi:hypothetical protein
MTDTLLSDDMLGSLADRADIPADEVIAALLAELGEDAQAPDPTQRSAAYRHLLGEIWRDDENALGVVSRFLTGGEELDESIDTNQVRHAQEFFEEHGVAIITTLFFASLPEAYLGRRGVQVLDMTGELVSNWTQRIRETGQFLINVLTPSPELARTQRTSLAHGESAARSVRRVRLTHSAVRRLAKAPYHPEHGRLFVADFVHPPSLWDVRMARIGEETDEGVTSEPLNQEDLLATLGTFTTVTFEALEKLGISFDDDDKRAFYHLWNVVGWHLGIGDATTLADSATGKKDSWPDNRIFPLEVQEMDELFNRLRRRLQGPTEQGRRLAATLVQDMSYPLPGPIQGGPAFVIRYLIGDHHADELEIEAGGYAELLIRRTRALERLARRTRTSLLGQLTLLAVGQALTRYALRAFQSPARGKEPGITIEPRIAGRWGIQTPPEADELLRS